MSVDYTCTIRKIYRYLCTRELLIYGIERYIIEFLLLFVPKSTYINYTRLCCEVQNDLRDTWVKIPVERSSVLSGKTIQQTSKPNKQINTQTPAPHVVKEIFRPRTQESPIFLPLVKITVRWPYHDSVYLWTSIPRRLHSCMSTTLNDLLDWLFPSVIKRSGLHSISRSAHNI